MTLLQKFLPIVVHQEFKRDRYQIHAFHTTFQKLRNYDFNMFLQLQLNVCTFRHFPITILYIHHNMNNQESAEDLTLIGGIMEVEEADMAVDDRAIKAINPN